MGAGLHSISTIENKRKEATLFRLQLRRQTQCENDLKSVMNNRKQRSDAVKCAVTPLDSPVAADQHPPLPK